MAMRLPQELIDKILDDLDGDPFSTFFTYRSISLTSGYFTPSAQKRLLRNIKLLRRSCRQFNALLTESPHVGQYVRRLHVYSHSVTPITAEVLRRLPNLRTLKIDSDGLSSVADHLNTGLSSVRCLDLSLMQLRDVSTLLKAISLFPSLELLRLERVGLQDNRSKEKAPRLSAGTGWDWRYIVSLSIFNHAPIDFDFVDDPPVDRNNEDPNAQIAFEPPTEWKMPSLQALQIRVDDNIVQSILLNNLSGATPAAQLGKLRALRVTASALTSFQVIQRLLDKVPTTLEELVMFTHALPYTARHIDMSKLTKLRSLYLQVWMKYPRSSTPTQDEYFSWLVNMFATMPDCVQDVYMNVIFGTQQEDFPLNVWTNLGKIFAQQRRKTNLHVVFGDKELENYAHFFPSQTYFDKSMNRCLGSLKGQGRLQIWTAQDFMYRQKGTKNFAVFVTPELILSA
ncbi:hypothetical protein IW261DRAFT_1509015 [Armillaria novae-zelandiae]|uniref:Uncharacterized protein n=1 Tax=Armillaria novae-zelandiae TaxID=153914 RepID=A0AA39NUY1_9AGAR|nr:hypothetical protein IW261DRAFT_1509015 [Armillaria novae-zelandiae]